MSNIAIASHLKLISQLMLLDKANKFQISAFADAAKSIQEIGIPVEKFIRDDTLKEIPGVGESVAVVIQEFVKNGTSARLEDLGERWPIDAMSMCKTTGVGPKTAMKFHADGVKNFDALVTLAKSPDNKLRPRMVQEILAAERKGQSNGRVPHLTAKAIAEYVLASIPVLTYCICGSIRRKTPDSKDIDIVACPSPGLGHDCASILKIFTELGELITLGENRASMRIERLGQIIQCDLWLVQPDEFGSATLYATGSKDHCVALRVRAKQRGWILNEYGLFDGENRKLGGVTEQEVYNLLDLPYYEPENRTGDLT
jgi:DNA polymerase (family X)